MHRRGWADSLVEVELWEAADSPGPEAPDAPDAPDVTDDRDRRRARTLRWVGLAVAAGLVVTMVSMTAIDARRDAARAADLAELAWVLPPLEPPLTEVWRSPGGWTVAQTADVMVVGGHERGTRALDLTSGEVLWTYGGTGSEVDCAALLDYREVRIDESSDAEFVYCASIVGYEVGTPTPEVAVPVDFVEIATGAQSAPLVVDGFVVMTDVVDGDLLVTYVDASAALRVVRWDPRSGEVWSYRSAPGLAPDGAVVDFFALEAVEPGAGDPTRLSYGIAEGAVRLTDEIALDLTTGEQVPVPAVAAAPFGYVQPLADGGSVEVRYGMSSTREWSEAGRVLNSDGSLRFEIEGSPWFAWQTDGSDADVLTVFRPDGGIAGLDPGTGESRWTAAETAGMAPTFVLEGVQVLVGSRGVIALGVGDGVQRWHAEDPAVWNGMAATDGTVVLVQSDGGAGQELVALDLRTGVEAWRTALPGSYWQISHGGGNLLLVGDEEIVALR